MPAQEVAQKPAAQEEKKGAPPTAQAPAAQEEVGQENTSHEDAHLPPGRFSPAGAEGAYLHPVHGQAQFAPFARRMEGRAAEFQEEVAGRQGLRREEEAVDLPAVGAGF